MKIDKLKYRLSFPGLRARLRKHYAHPKNSFITISAVLDIFFLLGVSSIVYGVSLVWVPAAYITAGLLTCGIAVYVNRGVRNAIRRFR